MSEYTVRLVASDGSPGTVHYSGFDRSIAVAVSNNLRSKGVHMFELVDPPIGKSFVYTYKNRLEYAFKIIDL